MKKKMFNGIAIIGIAALVSCGAKAVDLHPPASTPATPNSASAEMVTTSTPMSAATIETGLADLDLAVREASSYLNDNLAAGSKLMVLYIQSDYPALSEYIIDELVANTVNDRKLSMVDRRQIDAIREELNFQMSGAVDDESAQRVGRMLGAQTIISGAVTKIGEIYRLRIRAIDVETAKIQGQFNRNIPDGPAIVMLAQSSATNAGIAAQPIFTPAAAAQTAVSHQATSTQSGAASGTGRAEVITSPVDGTVVPGYSLVEKLAWVQGSAESHGIYIIEASDDEEITPHILEYSGTVNVTVVLRGVGGNRSIGLYRPQPTHGRGGRVAGNQTNPRETMFTIHPGVTLILDNDITLRGLWNNERELISVDGGVLIMNTGSTVTYNTNTRFGGGGVSVFSGTFEMFGGIITANTAGIGGGVYVGHGGSFFMRGGTITGNRAGDAGGGVYVYSTANFDKTGGTITGYTSDPRNGNAVMDASRNVVGRRGHAVFVDHENERRREATAGPEVELNSNTAGAGGEWQ